VEASHRVLLVQLISVHIYDFACNYLVNTSAGQLDYTNLFNNPTTIYDEEPDQFSFNFLGHSGKFIIGRNGKVIEQEQDNLRFSFSSGTNPNFLITDDEGNRFYFNNHDCNSSLSYGSCITNTWNLTQIITQLNDTVNFNYGTYSRQISVMGDITQSVVYGPGGSGSLQTTNAPGNQYGHQILSTIDFSTGQIQLGYDTAHTRSDLLNGIKYDNIRIYSKIGTALTYLKEFDLSYHYYTPSSAAADSFENKRLILDSVNEVSGTLKNPPYSFLYNFPTSVGQGQLAKHGFCVDDWGYFNGISNLGLVPTESVFYNPPFGYIATIPSNWIQYSGANRSISTFSNSTFLLNTIYYPTGGKTVMEYESNSYDQQKSTTGPTDFPQMNLVVVQKQIASFKVGDSTGTMDFSNIFPFSSTASPVTNATMTLTFRCASQQAADSVRTGVAGEASFQFQGQDANLAYDIKDLSCGGPPCTPAGVFTITGGIPLSIANGNMIYNWSAYINPLYASRIVSIQVTIQYNEIEQVVNQILNNNYVVLGGGLRIKSVTDYSAEGKTAKKRTYQYEYTKDTNGDGIPESYTYGRLMDFPSYVKYQSTPSSGHYVSIMSISASTASSMTSRVANNIIGYDKVIERTVDPNSGLDIGKTEYNYFNSADSSVSYGGGYGLMGMRVMNNNLNGSLLSKIDSSVSSGVYTKVAETDNFFSANNRSVYFSPKTVLSSTKVTNASCVSGTSSNYEWIACFYPSMKSEKVLLDSSRQYGYDQLNPAAFVLNKTLNYYDNPKHYQLTRSKTFDSKNNVHVSFSKYPQDYLVGTNTWTMNTVMDSLIGRNMVSTVIEKRDSLYYNGATTNGQVIGAQLNRYKALTHNALGLDKQFQLDKLGPVSNFTPFSFSVNTLIQDARYRQMISFDSYDSRNNVIQYTPVDQTPVSVIWDYNGSEPIAQVKNAVNADIAYTSFEADGSGNWTLPTVGIGPGAYTGSKAMTFASNTIHKTGLTSGKKYVASYWTQAGAPFFISGATATTVTGRTVNGWTYYEQTVTMTGTDLSIYGTGNIDELRIYPVGTQMTSLTYTPLVGVTSLGDPNSEVSFYEYDSLRRLKNIKDYQGNIVKNFQYNYSIACTTCVIQMQTFASVQTISYPVGVFSVKNKLLGNATNALTYISLWNSDTNDTTIGHLAAGADSMHFVLTVKSGQTTPGHVIGCRYYQFDLPYTQIDAIRNSNGEYVDFGDGTGMMLGATTGDSNVVRAPNTFINVQTNWQGPHIYWIHTYPDNSLKTLTFYHNDATEAMSFDNAYSPATSLNLLRNFRGNLPQNTQGFGPNCFQQASANSVSLITNWNTINSITGFSVFSGDGATSSLHMNYAQDFMANNKNLQGINTTRGFYWEGYEDSTFKISRLKSNWNTYFTGLTNITICNDHWNNENLSALVHLNSFTIYPGNTQHSYNQTGNPLITIPSSTIDSILNQIAAGAGQTISNGVINIYSYGTRRTAASNAANTLLLTKGWILNIDPTDY
jgi:hypothetical protein